MLKFPADRIDIVLVLLLTLAVLCLWVRQIGASFWVDETVTAFVVHHGAGDASLAVAPQVPKSAYYAVAWVADKVFGTREIAYRMPSVLFSLAMLWLVGRLAARLIDPSAAWFAVFACFGLKALNWEAADARPYAMGFCVMAAAALFLVRWLDSGRARDAAVFVLLASAIWRIHLIFWPAYGALALYAMVRLWRRETPVTWIRAAAVFGALGILLVPVLMEAIALDRSAGAHVIVDEPTVAKLLNAIQWKMMLECGAGAFAMGFAARRGGTRLKISRPEIAGMVLVGAWWLIPPVALFIFSQATGNSVFVRRYYSIALPGAALAASCLVGLFLPRLYWKRAAAVLGIGVLVWYGVKPEAWPGSDWRGASAALNALPAETPVIAVSPFIEAKAPEWRPDYPLPGFLYAHLDTYRVRQPLVLFPFRASEGEGYAARIVPQLAQARGFAIYGGDVIVRFWQGWFLAHAEFSHWSARPLGRFGDVEAVVVEAPRDAR